MDTQHYDWLSQLARDDKGGITLPSITRGDPYSIVFALPIDASADTITAALSLSPDAAALASFTVSIGAYDGATTLVTLALTEATVNALPADTDGDGLIELVFSVQLAPGGANEARLFAGNVFVSGKV